MIGQSTVGMTETSPSKNRVFVYEVKGLRQNDMTDKQSYPVRNSGSVFIKVPYSRMNEEMRRITRMGGEIVAIHPVGAETNGAN
ncbi:MAG: phycobilisome linker polypeptide [Synechococcales bacterium]|nr:phycobilisome linker polypeptide [Synechococcales bacterium]